jgi:ABC-2 type transport system permease protein
VVLKFIAYLIPMTWGIKSVQDTLVLSQSMFSSMAVSIVVGLIYLLLAYFIVKKIEVVLRKTGSLGAI